MISHSKLEDIYEAYRQDPNFDHLRVGQAKLIPGEGDNPIAFIVGEAPGAEEVMRNRPFVGASGRVLRQLMASAGLYSASSIDKIHEPNCWLTNTVKYRPLRNRTPTTKEIKDSRIYLRKEHQAVGSPQIIIPVGAVAFNVVMGQPRSIIPAAGVRLHMIGRRGRWFNIWPMLHPAYGLRNPGIQPNMERHWKDLGIWLRKFKHL